MIGIIFTQELKTEDFCKFLGYDGKIDIIPDKILPLFGIYASNLDSCYCDDFSFTTNNSSMGGANVIHQNPTIKNKLEKIQQKYNETTQPDSIFQNNKKSTITDMEWQIFLLTKFRDEKNSYEEALKQYYVKNYGAIHADTIISTLKKCAKQFRMSEVASAPQQRKLSDNYNNPTKPNMQ